MTHCPLDLMLAHLLSSLYTSSPSSRNIMKLFHLLLLLAPLSYSHFVPATHQAALVDRDHYAEREKVPGDNPAYYSREKAADQLFEILEFTIAPNPPIVEHRIFFYLRGDTGTRHLPGLADATLKL
ncbi:hypothetical protein BU26DRAFT_246766 [Trematosphaeria pertusa]|uniref:Uncharacterized protein n=1 Tax=Trematosphaeria pertusa TaxID=390896 RepID=A0A6A6IMX5_9PLEO|nr:uncharacterized protein BU26DRAFT_246766 [Trematosphaeria pertusa]KAF2251914.1 hypothetical protein BU26DRAFT_246766 [Trematosphaeria pertusa]